MLEASFRVLAPECLGHWEAEMPCVGQSHFPVLVTLDRQVSWETGTSFSTHHSAGIQHLLHIETLWSCPGGLWEAGR